MALFNSGSAGATRPSPTQQEGGPMGLKEYEVEINGHATTLLLSDEDARRQGLLSGEADSDPSEEVAALKAQLAEAEAKVAAAEEKERAAVEAKDAAVAKLTEFEAKAKTAAANKQASAPQNKDGAAAAGKSGDAG